MSKGEMFPDLEEQRRKVLDRLAEQKKQQVNGEITERILLKIIANELIEINLKLDKYLSP